MGILTWKSIFVILYLPLILEDGLVQHKPAFRRIECQGEESLWKLYGTIKAPRLHT